MILQKTSRLTGSPNLTRVNALPTRSGLRVTPKTKSFLADYATIPSEMNTSIKKIEDDAKALKRAHDLAVIDAKIQSVESGINEINQRRSQVSGYRNRLGTVKTSLTSLVSVATGSIKTQANSLLGQINSLHNSLNAIDSELLGSLSTLNTRRTALINERSKI